jgi:hypothetical protein
MKPEVLLTAVVFLSISASATVATFHGELENQGPQTELIVGYASDQEANITLNVEEKPGLNISYTENYLFNLGQESRSVLRQGENIPLKQFRIQVESEEPVREEYSIPVSLTAYTQGEGGSTAPRVVQEREYVFNYLTQSSNDYSFDGDLIGSNSSETGEQEVSESEENGLTGENQTVQEEQQEEAEQENPGDGTNPILVIGVVAVFTYTIYEAIT